MRLQTDPSDAFTVMSVFGLAAILDSTVRRVRVSWPSHEEAIVDADGVTDADIASIVREHADAHAADSWVSAVGTLDGTVRAPLSPRIGNPATRASWEDLQHKRHAVIDAVPARERLDLDLIGGLGEPAYWARGRDRLFVDYGASPWEMKTRNRGEEFLQNRLSLLAATVSARSVEAVRSALVGSSIRDEVGKDLQTSRTPTGLRSPGKTDNALAWCALWGLSLFPVRPVMPGVGPLPRRSRTGAVVARRSELWFGLPLFATPVSIGRVRSVMRSAALVEVIHAHALGAGGSAAFSRLQRQGVAEVHVYAQHRTDNPNAPEPWLLPGKQFAPAARVS